MEEAALKAQPDAAAAALAVQNGEGESLGVSSGVLQVAFRAAFSPARVLETVFALELGVRTCSRVLLSTASACQNIERALGTPATSATTGTLVSVLQTTNCVAARQLGGGVGAGNGHASTMGNCRNAVSCYNVLSFYE